MMIKKGLGGIGIMFLTIVIFVGYVVEGAWNFLTEKIGKKGHRQHFTEIEITRITA